MSPISGGDPLGGDPLLQKIQAFESAYERLQKGSLSLERGEFEKLARRVLELGHQIGSDKQLAGLLGAEERVVKHMEVVVAILTKMQIEKERSIASIFHEIHQRNIGGKKAPSLQLVEERARNLIDVVQEMRYFSHRGEGLRPNTRKALQSMPREELEAVLKKTLEEEGDVLQNLLAPRVPELFGEKEFNGHFKSFRRSVIMSRIPSLDPPAAGDLVKEVIAFLRDRFQEEGGGDLAAFLTKWGLGSDKPSLVGILGLTDIYDLDALLSPHGSWQG